MAMRQSALTTPTPAVEAPIIGAKAPIIAAKALAKRFAVDETLGKRAARFFLGRPEQSVVAVDDVDLAVGEGEVVAVVGESGCGKSTLGRMIAGLLEPTSGTVLLDGKDRTRMTGDELRRARLDVQMIFQDPMSSLNPRMSIGRMIGEAPRVHRLVPRDKTASYVAEVMGLVGLDPSFTSRYPHQLSGGQRQRVGIARALAVRPRVMVCDESVAALDVSIQAQILNQFITLREQFNLAYLFISHDLGVVEHISDETIIMYLGRIVERAPTTELFARPNHPYAQALLAEAPRLDTRRRGFEPIWGEIPSPMSPPSGCAFHPRCPHAMPRCTTERPALRVVAPGRLSACHLNDGV